MSEPRTVPTPRVLAVVPARGGSKGVPGKNLRRIGGVTLVARAVGAVRRSGAVDRVVVSSDDDEILTEARRAGGETVRRPTGLAGDTASSESAVLHALDAEAAAGREYDLVVLVQATSPFLRAADLAGAVATAAGGTEDAVVAAVVDHGFRWSQDVATGRWAPIGHEASHRPRRQDLPPTVLETGAFYVTRVTALRSTGSRFGRSARPWVVDATFSMEVDTAEDLRAAERLDPWWDERPVDGASVRLVVTDFDGVLTDDTAIVTDDGHEAVRVSRADGLAADLFRARGIEVAILSRETNAVVAARARKMKVEVVSGAQDKVTALADLLTARGLESHEVVFVGNDVTDVVVRGQVGVFATPDDAHPAARAVADIVVDRRGGAGVLRRLYDLLVPPAGTDREDEGPPSVTHVYVIAEIGINHNGELDNAMAMIDVAAASGCDAVKFQKRSPLDCVPLDQQGVERDTPWGRMTYLDYRFRVEFGTAEYDAIDARCKELGIAWSASPWDVPSAEFLAGYDLPWVKVASASVTDTALLDAVAKGPAPVIASTGMSTMDEIDAMVVRLGESLDVLMHTTSAYPCPVDELNLRMITTLQQRFGKRIGYSGHETGLQSTVAAVALGAEVVERHITLDRAAWGSDQAASVEPEGLRRLVRDIRVVERALGDGVKKVYADELPIRAKLRRH